LQDRPMLISYLHIFSFLPTYLFTRLLTELVS